jgi:2-keto-3-deoxy-L-rhamnonate aldolase RhmA
LRHVVFDFVIIDNEHGWLSYESIANMVLSAKGCGLTSLIRVPAIERECIQHYWDMGANGIVVPQIYTADDVKKVVKLSKFAPMGNKGLVFYKGNMDYNPLDDKTEFMKRSNAEGIILVQVETKASVENIDEILAVEGIDGIFIGPSDLSSDMGMFGQNDNPEFKAALKKVLNAARDKGMVAGSLALNTEQLESRIKEGCNLVAWNSDLGLFGKSVMSAMNTIQAAAGFKK